MGHMVDHVVFLNVAVHLLAPLRLFREVSLDMAREVQRIQRRQRNARGQVHLIFVFYALGQEFLEFLPWSQAWNCDLGHLFMKG